MSGEKTCFVIAPIGEPDSETRKRSDQILNHVITPAVRECGYNDPIRADRISEPGIITTQVTQHILEDSLVIADLTGQNPNVFYELAIRHVAKKPLVQIIQKGEQIPFDVVTTRTIQIDHKDLDSVAEARKEIVRQIKAVEEDPSKIDTPISIALDLEILKSGTPEQRSLADVLEAVSELQSSLTGIYQHLAASDADLRNSSEQILTGIRDLTQRSSPDMEAIKLDNARTVIKALLEANMSDNFDLSMARSLKMPLPVFLKLKREIEADLGDF